MIETALAILILLCLSGFFSGSETALTATSRAKMRSLEQAGNKGAKNVMILTENRERLIGAILLGNNLVNILASALATALFTTLFPGTMGITVATAVMTALVLIFAEVMPKTAAIARPEGFAQVVSGPMRIIVRVFAPITAIIQVIVRATLRRLGFDVSDQAEVLSVHDELKGAIDLHHEEGQIEKESRDIIRGALELDQLTVEDVMVHRKAIEMIDIDLPPEDIVARVLESKHTRIPLYQENPDNIDNIIGVLHAKDLLRSLWANDNDPSKLNLREVAMEPYFVPETTSVREQLDNFKEKQQHFALVIEEYGSLQGLVTVEDILEEIVGEIEDEYDAPVEGVQRQPDGAVIVDGDVTIRDLNRTMDWRLPDEEAVTIAGLVIHEGRCIPDAGQAFSFFGYRFEVLKKRRNQVTSLKVVPLERNAAA